MFDKVLNTRMLLVEAVTKFDENIRGDDFRVRENV